MQQRTCWRSTSAPRTAPVRASDESVFRLVSPSHRARQNHRPELQSTSHEIQTRHSNISLDRGTGSDLVLVLQKMFHNLMWYKIYLLLYYRITCIQKLSHIVKIKRGQRKCSGGVWFRSVPDDTESEHLVHLVRHKTSHSTYSYSKKSHFTDFWLFLIFFCLLFYHTEVLISLTFILGARNLTGPISNINLTQTSSVTSRDFDKVLFLCFWVISRRRFTSSPLWVLQSDWREERAKRWNYALMWKRTKWKRDETWSLTKLNESFTPAVMDCVAVLEEKIEISAISRRIVYIFAQIVKRTQKTQLWDC